MMREERLPIDAPAHALADGFAQHVRAWSRRSGAGEAVADAAAAAARAVSLALADGHVCVTLGDLEAGAAAPGAPAGAGAWRATLLASGVAGTADAPGAMPLVLDAGGRLYLHRYFDYERRLAQRLWRAARGAPQGLAATNRTALRAQLGALFAANAGLPGAALDWQKIATALAMRGRLAVISGGPGTGKTTTVVNLLACLIAQDAGCRIALAAPTGKAAARMSEAIRERAVHLPAAIRERLPQEASTIHRLLGVTPAGFVHHAGRRLAIDALVVDEASMLDLALATKLLEAVPEGARIVLLGDKDQLAAVESGAVFAELSADPTLSIACRDDLCDLCGVAPAAIAPPAPARPSDLHDASVWLTRNFRFAADSAIGRLATAINAGRADEALAVLDAGADAGTGTGTDAGAGRGTSASAGSGADASAREVHWIDDDAALPAPAAIEQLEHGYAPYFDAVLNDTAAPAAIVESFARHRALCAVREGARGVEAINAWLTRRLRSRLGERDRDPHSPWFIGRPVLVQRNEPVMKLFNGDIGIALPDASGELMVHFAQPGGGLRTVAPLRLPAHETAFAMTVHKAQGSEFDAVFVLLPGQVNRVLTRELLYTAVTRARRRVTLCAGAAVLRAAIGARTRRHSGLLARLAEGLAGAGSELEHGHD